MPPSPGRRDIHLAAYLADGEHDLHDPAHLILRGLIRREFARVRPASEHDALAGNAVVDDVRLHGRIVATDDAGVASLRRRRDCQSDDPVPGVPVPIDRRDGAVIVVSVDTWPGGGIAVDSVCGRSRRLRPTDHANRLLRLYVADDAVDVDRARRDRPVPEHAGVILKTGDPLDRVARRTARSAIGHLERRRGPLRRQQRRHESNNVGRLDHENAKLAPS